MIRVALLTFLFVISLVDARVRALPPTIVSLELIESAPLVRTLRLALRDAAPVDVEYWTDAEAKLRVSSANASSHRLHLARLRAGRSYHYRILNTGHQGTFRTDALPADLAAIRFKATGTATIPLALVHLYDKEKFKGYVIVDDAGDVVWFWRTKDYPFGMARRSNGNFVFMDKGRGIVEVTPAGEVVHELPQQPADREMHHDLITTSVDGPRPTANAAQMKDAADTVLYVAFDSREVDGKPLKGEAIWEWTPDTGALVQRWRSWDHLTPAVDRGPRFGAEWLHANSLAIGPRGNLLVSVHYLNQIFSIAPDWKTIEWRLGGVRATIPLPPEEQFSGQHTAHEVQPGRILLFDNGRDRGGYSRVVEFAIADGTATKVWEWKPARANYASAVSAARRLANGNTLVSFGMSAGQANATGPTEAYEVTPAGTSIWHLDVSGTTTMFRVEPIMTVAGER